MGAARWEPPLPGAVHHGEGRPPPLPGCAVASQHLAGAGGPHVGSAGLRWSISRGDKGCLPTVRRGGQRAAGRGSGDEVLQSKWDFGTDSSAAALVLSITIQLRSLCWIVRA